jgi:hypothetical protein
MNLFFNYLFRDTPCPSVVNLLAVTSPLPSVIWPLSSTCRGEAGSSVL